MWNYLCPCRIIGAILIVIGLYSVLWGKNKESKEMEEELTIEGLKCCTTEKNVIGVMETVVESADEANDDLEMQKGGEASKVIVSVSKV